ncbi:Transposon Tf2-9 polyprotein [Stylophora pistillata]|uniref:Transposon Tf2-9 polyprotein n=1 Tax=Stylophora pistillata TaxID=50429 RepID=A0A2B4SZU6_STYPI|nr:Transposon Tf2-9 polyprotein [Stylophora pistillata]
MQHHSSGALPTTEPPVTRRVNVSQSPFLHAFYSHHHLRLTIDTGAEINMMRTSLSRHIGAMVTKISQNVLQDDGRSQLNVVGGIRLPLTRHGRPLTLEALVVEDFDVDILVGTPFITSKDIAVRPAKREIIIAGCDVASYGCSRSPQTHYAVRACHLLRVPSTNTTFGRNPPSRLPSLLFLALLLLSLYTFDGLLSSFSEKDAFISLLKEFKLVFDSLIPGYNGAAGPIDGVVNMGPVKPPHPSSSAKSVSLSTPVTNSTSFKPNLTSLRLKAFYQIPLCKNSMKYCGVVTPFKGVRTRTRCAMGVPGSEKALEELMCPVLGDLLQEGCVAKVADDLYCGGNTHKELLTNWRKVLSALDCCNLGLSPAKTIICPFSTTILDWIWSQGSIRASPHRVAALASGETPKNVRSLRVFVGSYKMLNLAGSLVELLSSSLLSSPLRQVANLRIRCPGLTSFWFVSAPVKRHNHLTDPSLFPSLIISSESRPMVLNDLGATLYVLRDQRLHLASYFSAKFKKHQASWLPCEIEASSIVATVKHFAPYYGFTVELGRVKNPNKNPMAGKCVAELGVELLETTSNLSRRYSTDFYPEDIDEEPLTSEYVDGVPAHVPTPQSTPNPASALVPSELVTPPDPQTDSSPVPESSPPPEGSVSDGIDGILESAFSSDPRRSSRPTRRPAYPKDYVT